MPELTVRVQILHFGVHDICSLNGVAGFERLVDSLSGLQITNADSTEGLTLTRFDEFVFHDNARVPVDNDAKTGTKFVGADCCHWIAFRKLSAARFT
jgi:hypothetical protein